jgi:hypothetical protein
VKKKKKNKGKLRLASNARENQIKRISMGMGISKDRKAGKKKKQA